MLKQIAACWDRIVKELEGSYFVEEKQGNGTHKKIVEVEIEPKKESHYKNSDSLNEIISQFYPSSRKKATAAATMLNIWREEVAGTRNDNAKLYMQIFKHLQPLLQGFFPNENTLSCSATKWRHPLKERFGEDSEIHKLSVQMIGLSAERVKQRSEEYMDSVRANVRQRKESFTENQILRVIKSTAASDIAVENIIAVMLATGSRLVEVLRESRYEIIPDKPECIKVIGVAKARGETRKDIMRPLIGLLAEQAIMLIKHIRENITDIEDTSKLSGQLGRALRIHFRDDVTSHKLRYMWCSLAYQLHGGGVPEQEWLREMLGHKSCDTSLVYSQIIVGLGDGSIVDEKKEEADVLCADRVSVAAPEFPHLAHPKWIRLKQEDMLDRIKQLDLAYAAAGKRMLQKDAKKHGYGGRFLTEYWKTRA